MKPITFDTLSDIHKIELYSDNKRSCTAFISKITGANIIDSLYYISLSILPFIIICIPPIQSVLGYTYSPTHLEFWIFELITILIASIIFISIYPIIHDLKSSYNIIHAGIGGYIIELFIFDDDSNRKEKDEIFVQKDGFYKDKYNFVINEIFRQAEMNNIDDEILSFTLED